MPVQHVKNVTIGDGTDTARVRPSDWNSGHSVVVGIAGNTSNASSAGGTDFLIEAQGGLWAAGNGNTLQLWAPGGNGKRLANMPWERVTSNINLSVGSFSNPYFLRQVDNPYHGLIPKTVRFFYSHPGSSNRSLIATYRIGLYQYLNSSQISLATSASMNLSFLASSAINGLGWLDFTGMTGSLKYGPLWLALGVSNAADNTASGNMVIYGGDALVTPARYIVGGGGAANTSSTNASMNMIPFFGRYSAATAGFPANVHRTQVGGVLAAQMVNLWYQILEDPAGG